MIASFPPPPIALPLCHCPARSGPPCESCELQSYKERLGQCSPTRRGPDQIHTGLVPFEKLKPSGNVEEIQLGALRTGPRWPHCHCTGRLGAARSSGSCSRAARGQFHSRAAWGVYGKQVRARMWQAACSESVSAVCFTGRGRLCLGGQSPLAEMSIFNNCAVMWGSPCSFSALGVSSQALPLCTECS